ncbi:MAG: phage/plasmid primase, P4 family [Planctomycetia bacterium]|nr:phage/plasmid primase, P4 family [Planctomycetia bacterium]
MSTELSIVARREVFGRELKVYGTFEEPLFLAVDVAEWIEHSKASVMLETVDEDEKLKETLFTSGQNREMWFLTEDGLYEVLMQSRKPIAKEFKREVKKILRELRRTGRYAVPTFERKSITRDVIATDGTPTGMEITEIQQLPNGSWTLTQRYQRAEPKRLAKDAGASADYFIKFFLMVPCFTNCPYRTEEYLWEGYLRWCWTRHYKPVNLRVFIRKLAEWKKGLRWPPALKTGKRNRFDKPQKSYFLAFHDFDPSGQKGAKVWCDWLQGIAREVRNVVLPFSTTENHGKDLKDYFSEGHTVKEFFELAETTGKTQTESSTVSITSADNPHRLAKLYLQSQHPLPEKDDMWTLVHKQGWFRWKDGAYEAVSSEWLQTDLTRFCDQQFETDWQSEFQEWQTSGSSSIPHKRSVTTALVANVTNAVKSLVNTEETAEQFWRFSPPDNDLTNFRMLIPCRNGILHVGRMASGRKDYFVPSSPGLFVCNAIPWDYDPNAYSPDWEQMVQKNLAKPDGQGGWDVSKLFMLQEFLGYCLIPSNELQKFLILEGEGSNGKSAVLCGFSVMMGNRNTSNISLDLFGDKFAMNALRGKLVNVVDDLTETDRICEGRLKSIVSGMEISTDRKNRESISFTPNARLIFGTNNRPRFNDRSNGIQRRIEIIPFTHQVTDEEKRPEFCDRSFWESHAPGILNWCLRGLMRLIQNRMRLTSCPESESAKSDYACEINPALTFFSEYLEEAPDCNIATDKVYKMYVKWCGTNGLHALNSGNFGKELKRKFKSVHRGRVRINLSERCYVYFGIREISNNDLADDLPW